MGSGCFAKGQKGLTYPQLSNAFIYKNCSGAEGERRVERAGFSETCV